MAGRPDQERKPRTVLERVLWQREEDTYEDVVREFNATAQELRADATITVRHLTRLASGERNHVQATTRRVLQRMFGVPVSELLGPWTDEAEHCVEATVQAAESGPAPIWRGSEKEMVNMAAQRARKFSMLSQESLTEETLEQVYDDLRDLAISYQIRPLGEILGNLVDLQDSVFTLLETRQRPREARQLYVAAGITGGLLAKASHDLGETHAAATQARTAFVCAENADHNGLRAWLRGMQALIAYWAGRHREAIRYAQQGTEYARLSGGTGSVWLPVSEARSWAALGNAEQTAAAIQRSEEAAERVRPDELDNLGGICTFGRARQLYYAADAFAWLADENESAERYGSDAVTAYSARPPEYAFGDEAGSQSDLAIARINGQRPDVEGAAEALAPVLDLPPSQRINGIVNSTVRVSGAIRRSRAAGTPAADQLQEQIEMFAKVAASSLKR